MTFDCVVVGAGPAGSTAACAAARRGRSVLLVDRAAFPRGKVCGCCLNRRVLGELAAAGLGDLAARLGAVPLSGVEWAAGGRRAVLRHSTGVALSREAFDTALIDAAVEAGVAFEPGAAAALLPPTDPERRTVRLRRGGREWDVTTPVVVGANGLSGRLLDESGDGERWEAGSRIGAGASVPELPAWYPRRRVVMACGRSGYVGMVELEDGRLDVAAALDPDAVRTAGGLGALAERIVAEAGLPAVPGLAELPWKGTPRLTRRARGWRASACSWSATRPGTSSRSPARGWRGRWPAAGASCARAAGREALGRRRGADVARHLPARGGPAAVGVPADGGRAAATAADGRGGAAVGRRAGAGPAGPSGDGAGVICRCRGEGLSILARFGERPARAG